MVIPLWDQILVPSLPTSQWFTKWIMLKQPVICLLEERRLCFCQWFSHMKSSHRPFLGLKLLCLKVPSHCALHQLVLEKPWIVYVQNFLNFILFWNFASLGLGHTGHPIWLWKLWAGSVLIFKFLSLPHTPLLVRFLWGLLGSHPAASWLKMSSPLVWSLWGPIERKRNQ